jgi:hypothetical protein
MVSFVSYLRPLPVAEPVRLLEPFELFEVLLELLVEAEPLEVPLLRVLLELLPTRLVLLVVPLGRLLLLELFTRLLVLLLPVRPLLVVPLGRLVLALLMRLLELLLGVRPLGAALLGVRPVDVPSLILGRVLLVGRLLLIEPLLTVPALLPVLALLLPELMLLLLPLALGRTVAVGAGSLLLGLVLPSLAAG